jgi:hypothetical protein
MENDSKIELIELIELNKEEKKGLLGGVSFLTQNADLRITPHSKLRTFLVKYFGGALIFFNFDIE